jgi:hypothetical protein
MPVRDELGEMGPHLARLPAFSGTGLRIGQARRERSSGVLDQASFDVAEPLQERRDIGHGWSTTGEVSEPRRSMASVTESPGSR